MSVNATATTAASTTTATKKATGTDNSAEAIQARFMSLLVAQLKNQDPMAPMDNAQVTSQMAQLNTVTGIQDLNTSMQSMASSFGANQSVQATSMLGRAIMVDGNEMSMKSGSGVAAFDMQQTADSVSVNVLDSAGKTVKSIDLGPQSKGIHQFEWDGTNADGALQPEGTYKFEVVAKAAGQDAVVNPLTLTSVTGVNNTGTAGTMLMTGTGTDVALSAIKQIF
jgi:flagellar basal-body rod modification protein FlgD